MYKLDKEFEEAIVKKGFEKKQQDELLAKIELLVNDKFMLKLANILNETQIHELDGLTSDDNLDAVWSFLNHNLPTWESTNEWKAFRDGIHGEGELAIDEFNSTAQQFAIFKWMAQNIPEYVTLIKEARDEIFDQVLNA